MSRTVFFFFSSRRRHTRFDCDWSSDVCSSDLDYLTQTSSVRAEVDASRLGVSGHSMGGGGTLEASVSRPSLKAAVPMAPWDANTKNFSSDTVPTLIVAAQNDSIAPVNQHALVFYNSIPTTQRKM